MPTTTPTDPTSPILDVLAAEIAAIQQLAVDGHQAAIDLLRNIKNEPADVQLDLIGESGLLQQDTG